MTATPPRRPRALPAVLLATLLALAACTGDGEEPPAGAAPGTGGGSGAVTSLTDATGVVEVLEASVVTILSGPGLGSGVVYSDEGLIVTNAHVVADQQEVEIAFADGRRGRAAVLAADPVSDLALLRADRDDLPAATFQEELPAPGEPAVAIGSPLGFENTITTGVISGLHRDIPAGTSGAQLPLVDLIQTDAAISPGSSGGALANADGEVVGINEAYLPPSTGAVALGFAIPAATVVDVVEQLLEDGTVSHAFAGLVPVTLTERIAEQLGTPRTSGVVVAEVAPDGPAAAARLSPGDVLTEADGEPLRGAEEFVSVVRAHDPGDTLELSVVRGDGSTETVSLTLAERQPAG
ncbi:S1C family serine protease [Blastococcus sp. SYSU DS0828]